MHVLFARFPELIRPRSQLFVITNCTSLESHLPQHDMTLISSEHVLPLLSVLDTRNVYTFLLQFSTLGESMPDAEIGPVTDDQTITEDTAYNTVMQTIGTLKHLKPNMKCKINTFSENNGSKNEDSIRGDSSDP